MPAKTFSINLLGDQDLGHSPLGRIVNWATTYGRYIMIGTEVVVLGVFISRFSLDRKLTDLKEQITQKQAIIVANSEFEKDFRATQDRLTKAKSIMTTQGTAVNALTHVQSLLPPDVYFEKFDISRNRLTLSGIAGTTEGFSQFLGALSVSKQITKADLTEVRKKPPQGIQFSLTAEIAGVTAK